MCPGKNMDQGRDGKKYSRDIAADVSYLRQECDIKTIVCLLNDYEVRSIGCNVKSYE